MEVCRERAVGYILPGQRATQTSLVLLGQHICLPRGEMPGSWARCKPAGSARRGRMLLRETVPVHTTSPVLGPSLGPSMTQHGLSQKFCTLLILTFTFLWQCLCCQNFLGCASPSSQEGLYPTVHFFIFFQNGQVLLRKIM